MKLEETEKILDLYKTGKGIVTFVEKRLPSILKKLEDPKNDIDKHRDGFEYTGDLIQSFNVPAITYCSFTGSFGSSDTYSDIAGLDTSIFREYFLKYLNKHKNEILHGVGSMIIEDAEKKKIEAIKELKDLYKMINNIGNDGNKEIQMQG